MEFKKGYRSISVSGGGAAEFDDHFQAVLALIEGVLPQINWNGISKQTTGSDITYTFTLNGNTQFLVNVVNFAADYTISVEEIINTLLTEDGFQVLLEDSSQIVLEG